ncbi:MAG TPA: hypothetical protein VGG92_12640 [Caulobacteraceae bacterium]|jgi:hypothetical protein
MIPPAAPAAISVSIEHPKTYLLSVVSIPLKPADKIRAFSIATWGVRFKAVCHIPYGWTIKAGSGAEPGGVLEGSGSNGITWFDKPNPRDLQSFVLVTLSGPVQPNDVRFADGRGVRPATFKGHARVWNNDAERNVPMNDANIRLVSAKGC